MGIVVMSFPGCGKQTFVNRINEDMPPLATITEVRGDECNTLTFKDDFLRLVDERSDKYDIVFVPFNRGAMRMLDGANVDYDLFYPDNSRRLEFIQNFVRSRKNRDDTINIDQKWADNQKLIEGELSEHCHKHCLKAGEFIGNNQQISNYISSLNKA